MLFSLNRSHTTKCWYTFYWIDCQKESDTRHMRQALSAKQHSHDNVRICTSNFLSITIFNYFCGFFFFDDIISLELRRNENIVIQVYVRTFTKSQAITLNKKIDTSNKRDTYEVSKGFPINSGQTTLIIVNITPTV